MVVICPTNWLQLHHTAPFSLCCFNVLGAKARDTQVYTSADGLVLAELNHFRNTSAIIRAKVEAQAALLKERASHQQIKLQLNKLKTTSDDLQHQLETLDKEKSALKANQSIFGKVVSQPSAISEFNFDRTVFLIFLIFSCNSGQLWQMPTKISIN